MEKIKDYYDILGVEKTAKKEDIKKTYRKLSKTMHPDINKAENAHEEFERIVEAYEILSDDDLRQQYDRAVEDEKNSVHRWDFEKIFHFTHGTKNTNLKDKGEDVEATIPFTVEEVVQQKPITLSFQRFVNCEDCEGHGHKRNLDDLCPLCKGVGSTQSITKTPFGMLKHANPCRECNESGYIAKELCGSCKGKRKVSKDIRIEFTLMPPIFTELKQRFPYRGDEGRNGGRPGDLIVNFVQAKDDPFRIKGSMLEYTATIDYATALNGGTVSIPLPTGGEMTTYIPPKMTKNYLVSIPEVGIPDLSGRLGILNVDFNVDLEWWN